MTQALPASLWDAYLDTLAELGREYSELVLVEPSHPGSAPLHAFERAFPDRLSRVDASPDALVRAAAERASGDRMVFVSMEAAALAQAYGTIRQTIAHPRANVKLVAKFPWPSSTSETGVPPAVEEVGLMRGLPGMTVVVPADAPTARGATRAVAAFHGPAYLRIAEGKQPVLTNGTFALGRANVVRDGADLTVVAAGPLLGAALALAEEFRQVGVGVRVLDMASVKPIDAPALLRAARDTGALLVVEEHTVVTGLGEAVAATVAENFAVPVRRVGVPDLFEAPSQAPGGLGPAGDRLRDEAWELLRLRGKVQ